jgi:hypothetical protein
MATSKAYENFALNALGGAAGGKKVDWKGDTIKVALLSSSYTPNQGTHAVYSDVSTYEVAGTGYTTGGATLANKTATLDTTNKVVVLDADDVTWANSTITARYAVVYDATAGNNNLIGYIDLVSDQASNNGNFVIQWDATGIVRLTIA